MIQSRRYLVIWGVFSSLFQGGFQKDSELTTKWYFVSTDAIPWAEAKENCEELYRGNGSLLSIISEKQWKDHKFIFERQGEALVGTYWTGGKADSAPDNFIWDGSSDKVTDGKDWSESPWKKELPDSLMEKSRVVLEYTNTPEISLSFADETERKRYICEDKLLATGQCIRMTEYMDVVFALDASYSMQSSSKLCGKLMQKLVAASEPFESYRFAFFWFGDTIEDFTWSFHLTDNMTQEDMETKIKDDAADPNGSGNDYALAIEAATKELLDNPRPGVTSRNIIIFTDAEFEPDLPNPKRAAKIATDAGINIFVVQILDDEYTEDRKDTKDNAINMAGGYRERVFSYPQNVDEIIQEKNTAKIIEYICRT